MVSTKMANTIIVGSGSKKAKKNIETEYSHIEYDYVSLDDLSLQDFVVKLYNASRIIYNPFWITAENKNITEYLLIRMIGVFGAKVENFDLKTIEKKTFSSNAFVGTIQSQLFQGYDFTNLGRLTNYLGYTDYRVSTDRHLYVAGDSFAYGARLPDRNQRYAKILSESLSLPLVDLAAPGTSIDWVADQILRSDIQSGDILIWGLTDIHRTYWVVDDVELHLWPHWRNRYTNNADLQAHAKHIDYILTNTSHRLAHAIKSVCQVIMLCYKLKINLKILSSPLNGDPNFVKFLKSTKNYVEVPPVTDTVDEFGHPGPETHRAWAEVIRNVIQD